MLSWSWAWPISASMVLFHWRLGIPNHWSLFDIIWLLNVAFHSKTWWASWSHDSSGNPVLRRVYPGYEVWIAGWYHQHIHQCGTQWHNQYGAGYVRPQEERWWVFSNLVMCEMAGQCHGSVMEQQSFCTSITRSYDGHAKDEECGNSWFLLIIGM